MNFLIQVCHAHPYTAGLVTMGLANAAITAMPSPKDNGNQFYTWAFNFLHSAVGAISRIVAQYKDNGNNAIQKP